MYDRFPFIPSGSREECLDGWGAVARAIGERLSGSSVVVIECYPGVALEEVRCELAAALPRATFIMMPDLFRTAAEIDAMLEPFLGDDPVFGEMNEIEIEAFFDPARLDAARGRCRESGKPIIVLGPGASLVCPEPGLMIYADMARWELQQRQRRNEIANLGSENFQERSIAQIQACLFCGLACGRPSEAAAVRQRSICCWTPISRASPKPLRAMFSGAVWLALCGAHCAWCRFSIPAPGAATGWNASATFPMTVRRITRGVSTAFLKRTACCLDSAICELRFLPSILYSRTLTNCWARERSTPLWGGVSHSLRLSGHCGRREFIAAGAPAYVVYSRALWDGLHAGRELLHA